MEKSNGATTNFNSGDGERGPGWYDVYSLLATISGRTAGRVRLTYEPIKGVYPKWGIRVCVGMAGRRAPLGVASYGNATQGSCRTMAAACFQALLRAEDELDALGIDFPSLLDGGTPPSVA